MSTTRFTTIDGNEAVAHIAYRVSEVCSIYPITPASPMAEATDVWSAKGVPNLWGQVPDVIEMQSEGGAAGTVHGSLQAGALTTTFTASQGLMLMLPNMYKIAGELTSTVFHVAARSLAAQALSIFGDHQDVMAARTTGFALLASNSVQEAHDMALISHAATLKARVPFLHFFDGFRTSHEVSKISLISDEQIRAMIDDDLVIAHRERALNPDHPFIRGTAQNPDTYFQGRETVNPFYDKTPDIVEDTMEEFAALMGRHYHPYEYHGDPEAEQVIVIMGSGGEAAVETMQWLNARGAKLGVLLVRLFRPFAAERFVAAIPASVQAIGVLDRTKEPGAAGEPLYQDVITAYAEAFGAGQIETLPKIVGGRYGLSSKEFTPGMIKGVFDELARSQPKNHFTIGIHDDVGQTSLPFDEHLDIETPEVTRALFYGLGSDGTVGANKNSIKIIGENTEQYAQGYFVYDSRKSGSITTSHLRFGPQPIRSPYLLQAASFVACHTFNFIYKVDVLKLAAPGAVFLLNSPYGPEEVWDQLPEPLQQVIIERQIALYVIDASSVARNTGMGRRINTIMQTCFFALSGILPRDAAIEQIKKYIEKTYFTKGRKIIEMNFKAVDAALDHLHRVALPGKVTSHRPLDPVVPPQAPPFVKEVTAWMLRGEGDELPVSKLPVDGTYPSGTTQWEKRNIADFVPQWEPDICIQCGNCSFVCPHSVIRSKFYHEKQLKQAPEQFASAPISAPGFPETRFTLQIYLEDCTGCGVCVEVCPAHDWQKPEKKAINMSPKAPQLEAGRENVSFFSQLPVNARSRVDFSAVRGVQFLEPLFEFSGACAGCGETPYVKLLSQLFGPRLMVANATGCSSIYGGNLPTTPWTMNHEGQGPAWSNSLFEDNAEFGLGMRISADHQNKVARQLLQELAPRLDEQLVRETLEAPQREGSEIRAQRRRVIALKEQLQQLNDERARNLLAVVEQLVRRSVWLLGGDGWAYDIGSGGLDHVLSTGRNVNVLVLDTEVYSNTGGQMSKATPTGAAAKFASAGKRIGKKDLAMQAISYGNVYVAQVAVGANPQQTLLAMREAEEYDGPSLVLAYSHCIAHGYDLKNGPHQQKLAVESGYWPLLRYNPALRQAGDRPFVLDSPRPRIPFKDYAYNEMRYKMLTRTNPEEADHLIDIAQQLVDLRWQTYEYMARQEPSEFQPVARRG
ncbi:MAG: pyruvate:ferredoxin (flavodoxin) oxidoreductase [Thiotrichales bacterium]